VTINISRLGTDMELGVYHNHVREGKIVTTIVHIT